MAFDPDRLTAVWRAVRDPLTWTLGAILALFEGFVRHGADPQLVIMIVGFVTVPGVIKFEKKRNENGNGGDP